MIDQSTPNKRALYKQINGMSGGKKITAARGFLKEILSVGPMTFSDINRIGAERGHKTHNIYAASRELPINKKSSFGGKGNGRGTISTWSLLGTKQKTPRVLRNAKRATPPQSSSAAVIMVKAFFSEHNQACFTPLESIEIAAKALSLTFKD